MNRKMFALPALLLAFAASAAEFQLFQTGYKEKMGSGKDFLYYNIVPFNAGKEDLLAKDVIELEAKTGIDTALYSLTLHPEGFPASKKAEYLIASYRKFKKALAGSKVKAGVLLQSILGHWPRTDKKEEPWTRTVDSEGKAVRFCPLDPKFRQYIFETVSLLAKEHPCFILGDDDIRSFSPNAECFCPLHTAEFNRRTKKDFTPEEYRLAVRNSQTGDEIYTVFEQLRQDTVNGVCRLIREAIDSVDPGIPAGTCMPGWEYRFNGDASKAIAGQGQPPVMRTATGFYMERSSFDFGFNHLKAQALRLHYQNIPVVLDEADTCPHNLYSKSARSFHTKLCSAMFAGMNGAKIWYVNGHKPCQPITRKYTDVLAKYRYFDQVLAKTIQGTRLEGMIIPCYETFLRWHAVNDTGEFFWPVKSWEQSLAGIYGIPFRACYDLADNGVYALAGAESINRFNDKELKQLMTRKVLLDGEAAVALTKRGFGKYMGVTAEEKKFRFNREVSADGKIRYPFSACPGVPFLTLKKTGAEIITKLGYAAYSFSPDLEEVCPAAVLYKNELGGTICTTVFDIGVLWVWAHEERKQWLITILDRLNGKKIPYVSAVDQWTMLIHRTMSEKQDLLGFFNLGFDPLDEIPIRCAEKPVEVEFLTPEGVWQKLQFQWKKDVLTLPVRLECYEMAAIRIKNKK